MMDDDRAVAPVVGVALLIGITVILAFVVGSIIFGLTADPSDSPQATLSFTVDGNTVELNHEGGDTLTTDEIVIKNQSGVVDQFDVGELNAGQSEPISEIDDPSNHEKISVVWQDPTGDAENVLTTFSP